MEYHWEEHSEQQFFGQGYAESWGSQVTHTGAWPAGDLFSQEDTDETDLVLEPPHNIPSTSRIPALEELPPEADPYYVGQRTGRPPSPIRGSDVEGAPFNFASKAPMRDNYHQGVSYHSYGQEAQNNGCMTIQHDQQSQVITSGYGTESSVPDGSTAFSGEIPGHTTRRTSASITPLDPTLRESREYTCAACQRKYHRQSDLEKHARYHVPGRVSCETCGKRFHFPKDLRRHSSTHSKVKAKFKCNTCSTEFSRSDNRDRHQKKCPNGSNRASTHSSATQSTYSSQPPLRPRTTSGQSQARLPRSSFAAVIEEEPAVPNHAELGTPLAWNLPTPSSGNRGKQPAGGTQDMSAAQQQYALEYCEPGEYATPCPTGPMQFGFPSHPSDITNAVWQPQLITPPRSAHHESAHSQTRLTGLYNLNADQFDDELPTQPDTPSYVPRRHGNRNGQQDLM